MEYLVNEKGERPHVVLTVEEYEELQEAEVGFSTVYRLEHGKGSAHPRTVRKLAQALGVEPKELISERKVAG